MQHKENVIFEILFHFKCYRLYISFIAFLMRFDKRMFFLLKYIRTRREPRLQNLIVGAKRFLHAEITVSRLSFLKKISSACFIKCRIELSSLELTAYRRIKRDMPQHGIFAYKYYSSIPTYMQCKMYSRLLSLGKINFLV